MEEKKKVVVELNAEEVNDVLNGYMCWFAVEKLNEDLGYEIDDEMWKRIRHIGDKFGELMKKF